MNLKMDNFLNGTYLDLAALNMSGYMNHLQDYLYSEGIYHESHGNGNIQMQNVLGYLHLYLVPIIVILGLFGNISCGLTLTFSRLHKLPLTVFITGSIFSDCFFLLGLFCTWLATGLAIVHQNIQWCYFMNMVTNCSHFLSTWCGVVLLANCYTEVATTRSISRMRAKGAIIGLVIITVVVNVNLTLLVDSQVMGGDAFCQPLMMYFETAQQLNKISFFINSVLPFVIMLVLVILTFRVIKCNKNLILNSPSEDSENQAVLEAHSSNESLPRQPQDAIASHRNNKDILLSKAVCISFSIILLFKLPSLILQLMFTIRELTGTGHYIENSQIMAESLAQYLAYLGYMTKGILLLILWKPYRTMFGKINKRLLMFPVQFAKNKTRRRARLDTTAVLWKQNTIVILISSPHESMMQASRTNNYTLV